MEEYNFYQSGGEDPTGADFFNSMLDASVQQNDAQDPNQLDGEQQDDTNRNDFLDSLNSYADDTKNTDLQDQLDELRQQIELNKYQDNLDATQQDLEERLAIASYYQTPDGEDALTSKYEPTNIQSSINSGPKYTPSPITNSRPGTNNVGNIRGDNGQFKSYSSVEEGKNALLHQLNLYQTGKTRTGLKPSSTLYEAMATYAPASDKNNPKAYAEFVAKQLGVSPNTPISQLDPKGWANAITIMEGNTKRQMGGYVATFDGHRLTAKSSKRKYAC